MKEVTEWDNNPREMWVWDAADSMKVKRKVFFIVPRHLYAMFPVIAASEDNESVRLYAHCAEIISRKRMTNQQFSYWLTEKPGREWKDGTGYVSTYYTYKDVNSNNEVSENIRIREYGGEWYEPLVEEEE